MYRCDQPIPNQKSLQELSGCTAIFQCSSRYVAVFLRRNLMATAESSIISCERHRSISPMVLWMAAWTVEGPTPHRVQGSDPCRKLADLVKNWRIYSVAWKSSEILSPVVKIKILHPIQSKLSEHSKEEAQPFSNIKQSSVCISSHQKLKKPRCRRILQNWPPGKMANHQGRWMDPWGFQHPPAIHHAVWLFFGEIYTFKNIAFQLSGMICWVFLLGKRFQEKSFKKTFKLLRLKLLRLIGC